MSVELLADLLGRAGWKVGPSAEIRVRNPIFCPQTVEDFCGDVVLWRAHGRSDFLPNVEAVVAGVVVHAAIVVFHDGRKQRHDGRVLS